MIKESLVARLTLDKPKQDIVDEAVNKAAEEVVETLCSDYDLRQRTTESDSHPTLYDGARIELDMPGTSCTLQNLQSNPMSPLMTSKAATPVYRALSWDDTSFSEGTSEWLLS